MKSKFLLIIVFLITIADINAQDRRISSVRLNLRAGIPIAQNNSIVNNQGLTMSIIGDNQSNYQVLSGNMNSRGFGAGLSASLKDIIEIEAGFERIAIVQSFNFKRDYWYYSPSANTNISALVTDFELNKVSYGGYFNYPLKKGSKRAYVFGSFFMNTVWVDGETRLRKGDIYESGAVKNTNELYALDPETYSGPVFTGKIINTKFQNVPSVGFGLKYVVESGVAWKFGANYTIGDEVVYEINHKWYNDGNLINNNDWIHTVQNSFYYVNLGIPLLKGKKKDKIEIADEEVKEEKIIIAEEETFYPDYPDEGNKSLPNEKYMANNIIFLLDVSASMNQNEKMEKVKKAMIYMADSLRSFDQVGLVTYNVKAKVALEPTKSDAEHILDIKREIEVIRPKGSTKGIAGMETALEVAVGNYMNAANNQVILVTDGEFSDDNLSEKDLKEIVDEYKSQGVKISIIGFGESKVAQERLAFIASYAGGRYIKVESAEQFDDVFLKEIKLSSEKK